MLNVERILVVDLVATQAQAKGAFPSINRKEGQTKVGYRGECVALYL
jgi:predicted lipoprotein with Yx(FWY)xxD motif